MAQMQRIDGPIAPSHEIQIGTGQVPITMVQSFKTRSECTTATVPKTTPDMTKYARAFIHRPYRPRGGGQGRESSGKEPWPRGLRMGGHVVCKTPISTICVKFLALLGRKRNMRGFVHSCAIILTSISNARRKRIGRSPRSRGRPP